VQQQVYKHCAGEGQIQPFVEGTSRQRRLETNQEEKENRYIYKKVCFYWHCMPPPELRSKYAYWIGCSIFGQQILTNAEI